MEKCPDGYIWRKPHSRTSHNGVVTQVKGKCVKSPVRMAKKAKSPKKSPKFACPEGQVYRAEHHRRLRDKRIKHFPAKCVKSPSKSPKKSPKTVKFIARSPPKSGCPQGTVWRKAYETKKGTLVSGKCVKKSPKSKKSPEKSPKSKHACPEGFVWRKAHQRVSSKGTVTKVKGKCVKARSPRHAEYGLHLFE